MKDDFVSDLKIAFWSIMGFEAVAFISSFLLCGLIWIQHDSQKALKLFILLMLLFHIISMYLFLKSLLLSRRKRREWNAG